MVADTIRRKPLIKIAHNSAKEVLALSVSSYVYGLLGGVPSLTDFHPSYFAFACAVLVYFPIEQGSPAIAIALSTRTRLREAWGRVAAIHQVYDLASSSLALLLAFLYVQFSFAGPLLVVVPLLLVRHIYGMAIRLEQVNRDLLELMVKSIEARDPYTSGHSVRVSRLAKVMAEELGLSSKQIDQVATAALLHDVGKIYSEFAPLLRKDGKLERRELRLMQSHPVRGAELIGTVSSLRGDVKKAVRHHHESFGGRGYPDGLSGQEIPLASRIIAVVDTYDAMTTTRPYRKSLSPEAAFAELHDMVGRQFDPKIVDLFCTNERIRAVLDEELRVREEAEQVEASLAPAPVRVGVDESDPAGPRRWGLRPSMKITPGESSGG